MRPSGIESDLRGLNPGEFRVNTTELIQILEKGHYGVALDEEGWDRLVTWIDLNTPCHGTWRETVGVARTEPYHQRRMELAQLYAGARKADPKDPAGHARGRDADCAAADSAGAVDAAYAGKRRSGRSCAKPNGGSRQRATRSIDLGGGVKLELVLIPAGPSPWAMPTATTTRSRSRRCGSIGRSGSAGSS